MHVDSGSERLSLPGGLRLEADAHRFRLTRRAPWEPRLAARLLPEGRVAVTRQLMAGAYAAGALAGSAGAEDRGDRSDILLYHIFGLAGGWNTSCITPDAMRLAAARLAARGMEHAAAHCLKVAREETGHDALARKDMASLGLPADAVVEHIRPRTALALARRMSMLAQSEEPIAILGYAYALERGSLNVTAEVIAEVEAAMPPGVRATRWLRVHSAIGSDAGHVAEALEFIATLPPRDRGAVASEAFETARIAAAAGGDYPGDAAMVQALGELGWRRPAR